MSGVARDPKRKPFVNPFSKLQTEPEISQRKISQRKIEAINRRIQELEEEKNREIQELEEEKNKIMKKESDKRLLAEADMENRIARRRDNKSISESKYNVERMLMTGEPEPERESSGTKIFLVILYLILIIGVIVLAGLYFAFKEEYLLYIMIGILGLLLILFVVLYFLVY